MRLLFFSLSAAAFGETFIGLSLAEQLRRSGYESHFVVPPGTASAVEHFGFGHDVIDYADCPKGADARALIDEIIARIQPDALILSDYGSYYRSVDFHLGLDPWFIEDYGLPILPIDLSEWENTDFAIDLCGRGPVTVSKKILEMPAHLRPVPTAHLDAGAGGSGFPYRIVAQEPPVTERARAEVFAEFGLGRSDRLVMIPVSSWQQPSGGRMSSDMSARLTERVPELLVHYLAQLPETTHFVLIGQQPPAFGKLAADRLHVLPPCSVERYTTLLGSADLTIVFSPTSATSARAVLMDQAAMVVQNRFRVHDEADIARLDEEIGLTGTVREWLGETAPIDRFRLWPKGAYEIQEPMFTDNPYLDALLTAEILDEKATVAALENSLYDKGFQDKLAASRAAYLAQVADLPDAGEVVRAAIQRAS
ncbi:DUF6365 family protein [Amycolatopsis sp. cg5]|uniref:DUF6365 family protein n=1 Tax=Amycolatopsis sp. cg5 TaxID=3238802 RepID=UPI0035241EEB